MTNMKKKIKKELPRNPHKLERESRNKKSLDSFFKYCTENPEQRFFQALTNYFGFSKIGYYDGENWNDLWFMEEGIDYDIKL